MKLKPIIRGILILSGICIAGYLTFLGIIYYQFSVGCGFDDGPFKGIRIDKNTPINNEVVLSLKNGELIIDNRHDTLAPLVGYKRDGKYEWIIDMDVRNTSGYETYKISKIYEVKVEEGVRNLDLYFIADWSEGHEVGSMSIKKKSGKNSFCLSW